MNLKKEYTINNTPNAILYMVGSAIGNSFQKITEIPKAKYIRKNTIPKTSKNRTLGDF